MKVCECCGQPLTYVRHGVRLPARKAQIFDLVRRRPGISAKELAAALYDGDESHGRVLTIAAHVAQLNDLLIEAGIRVRGVPHNGYRVLGGKDAVDR